MEAKEFCRRAKAHAETGTTSFKLTQIDRLFIMMKQRYDGSVKGSMVGKECSTMKFRLIQYWEGFLFGPVLRQVVRLALRIHLLTSS